MMLFDAPPVPGLAYRQDLIGREAEEDLVRAIEALELSPFRFQGWTGKRLTHTFGWKYDFDDRSFAKAQPLPEWLMPLRDEAAGFANLASTELVHALITRYDPGSGIGWHRDRPHYGSVVGISLAGSTIMRFRRKTASGFQRTSIELDPRSAYLLTGEVREEWEHSIADHDELRYSITFRSLSDRGRKAANVPQA